MFLLLLGTELHSIVVPSGTGDSVGVAGKCVAEGRNLGVEPSHCQNIVISWTNLHNHLNLRHRHHCSYGNLKLVIDSQIRLLVKVNHGDVEAIIRLGGKLVNFFKTQPALPWTKSS